MYQNVKLHMFIKIHKEVINVIACKNCNDSVFISRHAKKSFLGLREEMNLMDW